MPLEQLWAGWRHEYVSEATAAERAASGESAARAGTPGLGSDGAGSDGAVRSEQRSAAAPPAEPDCVFCRLAASGPPSVDNLVTWRGAEAMAALNAYPYASGHLLVMPVRHIGSMEELTEPESAALWAGTRAATVAIGVAYQPDGINIGANLGRAAGAGIPQHLHMHVVPRWSGDTNFMTSIAGVRVLPEPLTVAWEKLHAAWPGV